jgi:hypothetical protein
MNPAFKVCWTLNELEKMEKLTCNQLADELGQLMESYSEVIPGRDLALVGFAKRIVATHGESTIGSVASLNLQDHTKSNEN